MKKNHVSFLNDRDRDFKISQVINNQLAKKLIKCHIIMDADELTVLLAQNSDYSDSEVLPLALNPYEEEIRVMGQSEEHKNSWRRDLNGPIFSLTILSALGGFLFGYDTGVVSGAMLQIQDDPRINPDTFWTELIVSVTVSKNL